VKYAFVKVQISYQYSKSYVIIDIANSKAKQIAFLIQVNAVFAPDSLF